MPEAGWVAFLNCFAQTMHLREVVINGFKSFADRTTVRLDPGVTCIVGPNGCGKSNIVDAIRWVLGEQSAKALRGTKMHDVIFQGTDKRKQLQSCEVSLIFTNCEAQLGTQFNEVEIMRKVDREGGGDYFLNGKKCRLKDIQRLFMDTGVGRASYSFMMQGQIDQILSSNPQERRTIFEEAAGITRYKAQRKEALSKLTLVDQNLSRVTDVIEEVGRQIGSLKRQASKALRYKRFKHRLTHLDLAFNGHSYSQRKGVLDYLDGEVTRLRKEVEVGNTALKGEESLVTELRAKRGETSARVQEAQQAVFELRSEKENAEKQAQFSDVRRKDLIERVEVIRQEVDGLRSQKDELSNRAEDAARSKEEASGLVESSDSAFREKNEAFQSVVARLADAERRLQQERQDSLVKEGGISRLRSQCTSYEVDLKSFQVKRTGFADALQEVKEQHGSLEQSYNAIVETRETREQDNVDAETAVSDAKEAEKALNLKFRELQIQIQDADRELAREAARLSTLEDLQARFEGFSEGAKAILQGKLGDILPAKQAKPFSSLIELKDEAWTAAVETLLGAAGEAIALEHVDTLSAVTAALENENLGRACLQFPTGNPSNEAKAPNDSIILATNIVSAKKPEMTDSVSYFFKDCYLCEDLEGFLTFWKENPDFSFSLVATMNGELIDGRGLVFAGRTKKGKKESSFIQRGAEIKRLKTSIAEKNEILTQLNEQAMGLQNEIEQAGVTVEEKRQRLVEIGQELSSLKSEQRTAEQALKDNLAATERQQRQLDELEKTRADLESRLEKAKDALGTAEKAVEDSKAAVIATEETIKQLREEVDSHRDGLAEVRLDLAEKRQRLELLNRGLNETEVQRRELEERALRRSQEADTLTEQTGSLETEAQQCRERAAEIEITLETTTENLKQTKETLNEIEQQISTKEESLDGVRKVQRDKETDLSSKEIKLAEERSQTSFIVDKVRTEYEREVTDIEWQMELWHADEEFETKIRLDDLDEDEDVTPRAKQERGDPTEADIAEMNQTDWDLIEKEIRELRDRISSLGAVNLVAIEEYAELKERFDFLTTQSEDLWKSKDELLQAIDEINTTSKTMFQDTFEQIRKNFIFTFEKLFAGGTADLKLIEAEDVLDSGIEIIARPPGTKLQTLSLLSGGQRTMTAVGLLFAIYMVKPSPFAVLDELDAPLDDANIGRFTDMVTQFVKYSQFLIITHNKRTVSAADTIYGVTMQERGVTKLVSMRFNKDKGDTEELEEAGAGI